MSLKVLRGPIYDPYSNEVLTTEVYSVELYLGELKFDE